MVSMSNSTTVAYQYGLTVGEMNYEQQKWNQRKTALWGNVMIRVWFIFAMIRCVLVHDLWVRMHRTSSIHFRRCWICLSLLGSWVTVGFLWVMEYQYETATKFPPFLSIVLDDMEKHGIWQSHRKEEKNQLRKHDLGFNICAFLWGVKFLWISSHCKSSPKGWISFNKPRPCRSLYAHSLQTW